MAARPRKRATAFNAVVQPRRSSWDGRAPPNLADRPWARVAGPAVEMNKTPDNVIATLVCMPEYVAAFETRLSRGEDNPVRPSRIIAKAIESFEANSDQTRIPALTQLAERLGRRSERCRERPASGFIEEGLRVTGHNGIKNRRPRLLSFGLIERRRRRTSCHRATGALRGDEDRLRRICLPALAAQHQA